MLLDILITVVIITVVLQGVLAFGGVLTWVERKQSAVMQHRTIFLLAPFIAWFFALAAFAVIPFTPSLEIMGYDFSLQISNPDIGLLFAFAMMGMAIYGVVLGGWASNNNFALLGAMRAT